MIIGNFNIKRASFTPFETYAYSDQIVHLFRAIPAVCEALVFQNMIFVVPGQVSHKFQDNRQPLPQRRSVVLPQTRHGTLLRPYAGNMSNKAAVFFAVFNAGCIPFMPHGLHGFTPACSRNLRASRTGTALLPCTDAAGERWRRYHSTRIAPASLSLQWLAL